MEAVIRPTTCDRCGKPFNTTDHNPRRFCSIACEEGRSPLPQSDPASDGYHLYLQGQPEALVGNLVFANGLRLTDYSPDWHKNPSQYSQNRIVSHDETRARLVLTDNVSIGQVVDLVDGQYVIEYENNNTENTFIRTIDSSIVVSLIRQDIWWANE